MIENASTKGDDLFVILIAPNVCERMGGEAIKALHIWLALEKAGVRTHQITHERVRKELEDHFPHSNISYVRESFSAEDYFGGIMFEKQAIIEIMFEWRAARMARELLKKHPEAVVHFTSPVSPILPFFRIPEARVVIGPINGNIYYPAGFRHRESRVDRIRRLSHRVVQFCHKLLFRGKQSADAILVAGGERTYRSATAAGQGAERNSFWSSIDHAGILESAGANAVWPVMWDEISGSCTTGGCSQSQRIRIWRFAALAKTKNPVTLEIIGRGPEKGKASAPSR